MEHAKNSEPGKRPLGRTDLMISPIGYGAFKIGRNQGIKYPEGYELPDEAAADRLLNTVLDLGINLIDTAPAYGVSEERIGRSLRHRRAEFVLSTKVGETFDEHGRSTYDFSAEGVQRSVARSLRRLQTEVLDIVLIHSNGCDREILEETPAVETLQHLKQQGLVRYIGLSGKTVEGAELAIRWADVLMIEYHLQDRSHANILNLAARQGIGIFIKKGLAAGRLPHDKALRFLLAERSIHSVIVGSLNAEHLKQNIELADSLAVKNDADGDFS